mgnify:FL=1
MLANFATRFALPPAQPVTVSAPEGMTVEIDGIAGYDHFQGRYFPSTPIRLKTGNGHGVTWRANGRTVGEGAELVLDITEPTEITLLPGGEG